MKIKHTVRVLAVVLVLAMMPLYLFGCGNANGKIAENLVELMVGDGSIKANDDNRSSKSYITALDTEVTNLVKTFSGTGWSASYTQDSNSEVSQWAINIYKMTLAWATKGSEHHKSGDVLDRVKAALESSNMNEVGWGKNIPMNERCDSAEYLIRALLILDDAGKVSDEVIESAIDVAGYRFPAAFGEGVGYARSLYIALGVALLSDNETNIESILTTQLPIALSYARNIEGLHEDGSFILGEVASSGSYGVTAFNIVVEILSAISGSDYDFADEQKAEYQTFVYNWATKSIIPSLYNGSAFAGTVGSYIATADKMGGKAISALLAFADYLDDDERANEIKAIVKGYSESNNESFASGFTSYGACRYQKLAKDDDITSKKVTGAFSFAQMDKLTILGNKYSVSLSISSDRSVKYETRPIYNTTNAEKDGGVNGKGWYTGDGMLLLYTNDNKVDEKYWKYVNAKRIPGTTADSRDRVPADDGTFDGITSFAGSAVLGSNAISSYLFYNNNSQLISDLTAKKSYFFFDGKIVALGAGITNTYVDPNPENGVQTIETTIENILTSSLALATSADDIKTLSAGTIISAPELMYVMKYGGIYVPADKNDDVYCRVFTASDNKTNFIELWIDHGQTPENASYEYAIVPSSILKMAGFFDESYDIGYTVLANTTSVQAVKDTATGLVGYTFWEGAECNGFKTDFACNMLVKESDSGMTIALSDYTQYGVGNRDGNTITIPSGYSLKGTVNGVTLNGNVLTIDRAVAADGNTITIQLTK